jgi:hypothetical protein
MSMARTCHVEVPRKRTRPRPAIRHRRLPPVPTWTCPHCGFVHRPADILRLNFTQLQCKQCRQAFESKPYMEEGKLG